MRAGKRNGARKGSRAIPAVLFAALLVSCSSTSDNSLDLNKTGFAAGMTAEGVDPAADAEGVAVGVPLSASIEADGESQQTADGSGGLPLAEGDAPAEASSGAPVPAVVSSVAPEGEAASATPPPDGGTYLTVGQMPADAPIAAKKKSFLSSLFGPAPAAAASPAPAAIAPAKAKAVIELPKTEAGDPAAELSLASLSPRTEAMETLPGVRTTSLFEIKRKSGIDDDSDIDLNEEAEAPLQLASAGGYARTGPNGLLVQRPDVDVSCLKPSLVRMLKQIERHYGKKMIVTSGYRSPQYNKRVNGAKKSMHMYCAAADVQVPGVNRLELARYVRMMPGRGGVGTYCHTESIHIDVGPERDWNWKCRRRKA